MLHLLHLLHICFMASICQEKCSKCLLHFRYTCYTLHLVYFAKTGDTMKISEDTIQRHLFNAFAHFEGQVPEFKWFFHVPNGGTRNIREAVKFKSMGVKSGVPDILLPVSRKGYNGLAIELKAGKNKPSENQLVWIDFLQNSNWYVTVCYTWEEAAYCALLYCGKQPSDFSIQIDNEEKYDVLRQAK